MIWAKYRNWLLLVVYVLFFLHTALWHHWGYTGVGHLGFGEFFGTLRSGVVTAGTVFSIIVFIHAIFFGGLFCGWFCHWGITQDVASWVMRKCGIKPVMAQLDSKLIPWFWFLILLAQVGLYWFFNGLPTTLSFNASATPVWTGVPRSILLICMTTLVSGFLLIFLFGERAFCRSICTFRLWFSWFEKFAPHKVRQVKQCTSCQLECTAVCPMGLDVASEIRDLGHVKNSECIKCHICIGACPNSALKTSMRKNEFHRNGNPAVQPATFSSSISLVQLCMAIIVLIVLGFDIGGNMSLSLGFITGFLLTRTWETRSITAFESFTAIIIFTGLYFKMDMNDPVSLLKGLTAISLFIITAKLAGYEKGFKFIRSQARETSVSRVLLAVVVILALFLGVRETQTSLLIHKANAALIRKDLQSYASIMEGCAAGHSDPAGAYYDLGKTQLMLKQPEKAVESFKKSISLIYKIEAVEAMLNHLLDAEEIEHWFNLASYLADKFPAETRFKIIKANALAQKGDKAAAEKLLNEVAVSHPENHDIYISLGEIRLAEARHQEAKEMFEKAYALSPASSAYFIADIHRQFNNFAEAEKYYAEAVTGEPNNIIYRLDQGSNLAAQRKFAEAISVWQTIKNLDPEFAPALENIKQAEAALAAKKAAILNKPAE